MAAKRGKEVEVKLRVANLPEALRSLRQAGARKLRCVFERNTLFDTAKARLRKRGQLLRLRVETPRGQGKRRAVLTFKGPSASGTRYKVREEVEYEVGAPGKVAANLAAMGLKPVFRYEKTRTSYRIPALATLQIELDEVPFGCFFELEGPPRAIDVVARRLGYAHRDYITKSYLALHAEDCRRRGRVTRDMVFHRKKFS